MRTMCKIEVKCNYCSSTIVKPEWQIKQHNDRDYRAFYCNTICQIAQRRKEILENFKNTGLIKCCGCKEEKSFTEFSKGKYTLLGFQRKCKSCYKKIYEERKKIKNENYHRMRGESSDNQSI